MHAIHTFLFRFVVFDKRAAYAMSSLLICWTESENAESALTLKAPIKTAADDIHKYFFIVFHRK